MATDIERLVVSLEANIKKYEQSLAKATASTQDALKNVESGLSSMESAVESSFKKIATIVGAGAFANEVRKMSDVWQEATNKIKAAGVDDAVSKATTNEIADIASRARAGFEDVASLYARLTRTAKTFGATQGEVAVATETVSKSLKISGASIFEVQSTLVQLGQALGSGRLQGDELRSLTENAPVLAAAIAKEFGVAIGELKNLGAAGELSAERVFSALVKAAPEVEAAFAKTIPTITDAFKVLETQAIKFIGNSDQINTVTSLVSKTILLLANNMQLTGTAATALGIVLATRLVAAGLAPAIAAIGTSVIASTAAAGGFTVMGAAATVSAGAIGLLRGALLLVGGPVGAAILGLTAAVVYLSTTTKTSTSANDAYAASIARIDAPANQSSASVKKLGDAVGDMQAKLNNARIDKLLGDMEGFSRASAGVTTSLQILINQFNSFSPIGIGEDKKKQGLDIVQAGMSGVNGAAEAAAKQIVALGDADPSFATAFAKFRVMLSELAGIEAKANSTRAAIEGAVKTASVDAAQYARRKEFQDVGVPLAAPAFNGVPSIEGDPDVARERLKRKVVLAEMDTTKRKILDKTKELYDASQKEGGGTSMAEAEAAARKIVAAEAPEKKERKGPKSAEDKFADDIRKIQQRTAANDLERESLKLTNYERERQKNVQELTNEATKAGLTITPQVKEQIDTLAAAYAKSADSLKQSKEKMQEWQDLQKFVGNSLSGFFSDVVSGGKNAEQALSNLIKKLIEAALQAALLGEGPLAGILGTKGVDGQQGGAIGGIVSGIFGKAAGGPVNKNQPYVVGEKRPELFVPSTSGRIIPNISSIGKRTGQTGGRSGGPLAQMGDTIVRIINGGSGNKVGVQKSQQSSDGGRSIDISIIDDRIAESLGTNGKIARLLQDRYGLSRMNGRR